MDNKLTRFFRNKSSKSKIAWISISIIILIIIMAFVRAPTIPFTITEKTIYGITENTVYLEITENPR